MYVHTVAGVKEGRLVEAHGSFSTASCIRCHSKQDTEEVKVRYSLYTCIVSSIVCQSL